MRRIIEDEGFQICVFERQKNRKHESTIIPMKPRVVDATLCYEVNSPNRSRGLTGILEELPRSSPLGSSLDFFFFKKEKRMRSSRIRIDIQA